MRKPKTTHLAFTVIILLSLSFVPLISAYVIENTKYGFSIISPVGWDVQENVNDIVVLDFTHNLMDASIIVTVEEGVEGSADDFADTFAVTSLLSSMYSNYNLLYHYPRYTNGGVMGHEFVYTVNELGIERKYDHMVFFENNNAYAIICCALTSEFDRLQNTFDFCIETFAMLPASTPAPTPTPTATPTVFNVVEIAILIVLVVTVVLLVVIIGLVLKKRR